MYLGQNVVNTLALEPGERGSGSWELPSPAADSYVRIDIERPGRRSSMPAVSLMSNPVVIDVAPQRSSWR